MASKRLHCSDYPLDSAEKSEDETSFLALDRWDTSCQVGKTMHSPPLSLTFFRAARLSATSGERVCACAKVYAAIQL